MKRIYISSIKNKILIGFIIFFIAIGILFTILLNTVYLKSFKDLEEANIERNIEIVNKEIQYNLKGLAGTSLDWARWDDTYLFAQGLNETYIETNLVDENFKMYGVDIILFTDNSGRILYGKQKHFETEEIMEIEQVALDIFFHSSILGSENPELYFNDIVVVKGIPMIIDARPILKTDGSGTVQGNVIFGRFMDKQLINEISNKLSLGISLELVSKVDFDKLNLASGQWIEIPSESEDYNVRNYYISDFSGMYYTKITVKIPRDVIMVGYNSIKVFIIIVPLVFTFILVVLWTVLNKLVLSRIINLNKQVIQISEGKSVSARIHVDDKMDEISRLSLGINSMLDGLESLQDEISEVNNLLEAKVLERTNELETTNHKLELEIIQRQRIQDEVTFLAYHDALTELPNRLLLTERLKQGILQAKRQGTLIGVMFLDLDGFKMINDTLGHGQGDELLKQVAIRLSSKVRKSDCVCRMGGDEFIFYINGYKKEDDLDLIASKIMDSFKEPFVLKGHEYFITGSMGISQYPIDGSNVEDLIKSADMAMYKAKALGKNRYQKC